MRCDARACVPHTRSAIWIIITIMIVDQDRNKIYLHNILLEEWKCFVAWDGIGKASRWVWLQTYLRSLGYRRIERLKQRPPFSASRRLGVACAATDAANPTQAHVYIVCIFFAKLLSSYDR